MIVLFGVCLAPAATCTATSSVVSIVSRASNNVFDENGGCPVYMLPSSRRTSKAYLSLTAVNWSERVDKQEKSLVGCLWLTSCTTHELRCLCLYSIAAQET